MGSLLHELVLNARMVCQQISSSWSKYIEPPGKFGALEFLKRTYMEYTDIVRAFVEQHPSHALIEG
jgi:hypothetical protein